VLGGPISGFILDHMHWLTLSSWRWLFVLEGSPALLTSNDFQGFCFILT